MATKAVLKKIKNNRSCFEWLHFKSKTKEWGWGFKGGPGLPH
jgi:hypothetical protein